jgi:polar amino acid transport system substrate-binding protein
MNSMNKKIFRKVYVFIFLLLSGFLIHGIEVKTAYQDVYPKFIIKNINGVIELSGLCIEIENAIEKSDPDIKFIAEKEFLPFTRIETGLTAGSIEAFCGLVKTREREGQFQFIYDLYQTGNRIVARADEKANIAALDDIKKLDDDPVILALYGTAQSKFLKDNGFNVDDGAKSVNDNFSKLINHRGRFFYQSDLSVFAAIKEYNLYDYVKVYPAIMNRDWQCFVFAKNAPKVKVEAVKKALEKIKKSGELDKIIGKYFSVK